MFYMNTYIRTLYKSLPFGVIYPNDNKLKVGTVVITCHIGYRL